MERRKILIAITVLILLALLSVLIYVFINAVRPDPTDPTGSRRPLFPFGNGGTQTEEPVDTTDDEQSVQTGVDIESSDARLRKIADFPTTAVVPFYTTDTFVVTREVPIETEATVVADLAVGEEVTEATVESEPVVLTETIQEEVAVENLYARYNRMADGFIFESKITGDLTQQQVTDTDIPNVQEAVFGQQGGEALLRFFNQNTNTIESFLGRIDESELPERLCIAPISAELSRGSTGNDVELLQIFLNYELTRSNDIDGEFGASLESLVKEFQGTQGIAQTGTIDQETRLEINEACTLVVEDRARQENSFKELTGGFLAENIKVAVSSPDTTHAFYLLPQTDTTAGITHNLATGEREQVFSSSISEWWPQWVSATQITLTTKPSATVPGYVYSVNPVDKAFTRLLGNINGLTTNTSPDGSKTIYSESTGTSFRTIIYTFDTRSSIELSMPTLPEKCTWGQDSITLYCGIPQALGPASYPDHWYQRRLSFSDSLWMIHAETGETTLLVNPLEEVGEDLDVIAPKLDSKELYLFFIDKTTQEPWVLTLS